MKNQEKLNRPIVLVGLVTVAILMVPLVAMQFTNEVKWGPLDFLIMGALIFSTGLSYVLVTRSSSNIIYRVAMALAIGSAFLLIWANLAVGLIGSGPNVANLLYMGVLAVGLVGTYLSHFTPSGMEKTMYATAFSLAVLAVIAVLAGVHERTDSSVTEIFGVNAFFAFLFCLSGLLFRYTAKEETVF